MNLVAFTPKYHEVPDQLIAVLVPAGKVTREIWEEALAIRIEALAMDEVSPEIASFEACKLLGVTPTNSPGDLAQRVFKSNALFKAQLRVSGIGDEHFPVFVHEDDPQALRILKNDTLAKWLHSAHSFIESNKEALIAYTSGNWRQRKEYEDMAPHMPDVEVRPYADYIKERVDARICYQLTDSDEFQVITNLYEFNYSISHHHGFAKFRHLELLNSEIFKDDLEKLNKNVAKFNRTHGSKISFKYTESTKYFFKKIYTLNYYTFELELPLVRSTLDIEKTFFTFYCDLLGFFKNEEFDIPMPSESSKHVGSIDFLKYLETELLEMNSGQIGY